MEKSSFFNSIITDGNYDRTYKAEDFAEYFNSFIGNGVFITPSTNLQVMAKNGMTVTLKKGKAWINGYYYNNTTDLDLKLDIASNMDRIDTIVIQLNHGERKIKAKIIKGVPSANPVMTNPVRTSAITELVVAKIYIKKVALSIGQEDITDLRMNSNFCGYVKGVVDQIDTTTIFNQFQSKFNNFLTTSTTEYETNKDNRQEEFDQFMANCTTKQNINISTFNTFMTNSNNAFNTKQTERNTQFNTLQEEFKKDFQEWFDSVKDILDGDTATALANQVATNKQDISTLKTDVTTIKDSKVIEEWEDFKANGREIGGDITLTTKLNSPQVQSATKYLKLTTTGGKGAVVNTNTNAFSPSDNSLLSLGNSTFRWKGIYLTPGEIIEGTVGTAKSLSIRGQYGNKIDLRPYATDGTVKGAIVLDPNTKSLYPLVDNDTMLGTSSMRFKDIYVGDCKKDMTGYTKLPNGFLRQWGKTTIRMLMDDEYNQVTITFPCMFSTNVYCRGAHVGFNATTQNNLYCSNFNVTLTPTGLTGATLKIHNVLSRLNEDCEFQIFWFAEGI